MNGGCLSRLVSQSLLEPPILLLKPFVLLEQCAELSLNTAGVWHSESGLADSMRHEHRTECVIETSLYTSDPQTGQAKQREPEACLAAHRALLLAGGAETLPVGSSFSMTTRHIGH